ncbi:unnamed protein product [Camellia sinensis]
MSGTGEKGSTTTKTPADFLKSIRGRPVVVKLNSGVDYRGHHLLIEYFLNNLVICGFPKGGVIPWRVVEVMKLVAVPFLACPCSPLTSLHYILFCILACLDGYMNIAMEQTEEYVNGQLKNKYGDAFIRGNNVLYISTSKRTMAEGDIYLPIGETTNQWKVGKSLGFDLNNTEMGLAISSPIGPANSGFHPRLVRPCP